MTADWLGYLPVDTRKGYQRMLHTCELTVSSTVDFLGGTSQS